MKAISTIPNQVFFKSALPSMSGNWQPRHLTGTRSRQPLPFETEDSLGRKEEIVCAVILALCLLATFGLFVWQLAFS